MATKPVTVPRPWAINPVWLTGPFIGLPTKADPGVGVAADGHRPGSNFPTAAEHENYQSDRVTDWVTNWLFLGSFTGAADAHIVETNAGGRAGLFGLDVNNSLDAIAATFTGANVNFPTVLGTTSGLGATVFQADVGVTSGIGYSMALSSGTPTGFLALLFAGLAAGARGFLADLQGAPNDTYGYRGAADAATAGDLLSLVHDGTGQAITVSHTGLATLPAVSLARSGGGVAGTTLQVFGDLAGGIADAVQVTSATGAGANAQFVDMLNNTGFALRLRTAVAATLASRGLRVEARGASIGAEVTAIDGDAVRVQSTGTGGAALNFLGRATDPTVPFFGRMDHNSTTGSIVIGDSVVGNFRDMHATRGGIVIGDASGGIFTSNNAVVWVPVGVLSVAGQSAPVRANTRIVLSFTCESRSTVASAGSVDVTLEDLTIPGPGPQGGTVIVQRVGAGTGLGNNYALTAAVTVWQRPIVLEVPYVCPVAGDRIFVASVKTGTANGIQVKDVCLKPYGAISAP